MKQALLMLITMITTTNTRQIQNVKRENELPLLYPKDTMQQLARSLGLGVRQETAFGAGFLKVSAGELKKTTISVWSTGRSRISDVNKKSAEICISLQTNTPPRMIAHWDGKKIMYAKKKK